MSSTGVVAVVMSDDDVEYYSETDVEDELTETILELILQMQMKMQKNITLMMQKCFSIALRSLVKIKSLKDGHMSTRFFLI